jgi:hypothetical protein
MKFGKTLYKKVKMETQRRHLQLKKKYSIQVVHMGLVQ